MIDDIAPLEAKGVNFGIRGNTSVADRDRKVGLTSRKGKNRTLRIIN